MRKFFSVKLKWGLILVKLEVEGMVLTFGVASRYCTWVFYFKDYNTKIQISDKKRNFKPFWWLTPRKTENDTFLEN